MESAVLRESKAYGYYEGQKDLNICIVSGLANARTVMERVKEGEVNYHLIEVMACRRGCIMGRRPAPEPVTAQRPSESREFTMRTISPSSRNQTRTR